MRISRRLLMGRCGQAMALGALGSALPLGLHAADEAGTESDVLLTMVYPNSPRAWFEARRYEATHIPLLRKLYGDSIERVELRTARRPPASRPSGVRKLAAPAGPGPSAAVLAAATIWIRDLKAFSESTARVQTELMDDLQGTTDIPPIVQYDRVAALLGDDARDIGVDGPVFSTYFPGREGSRFDARYYGEKVIPLMVKLYGSKAIRRIQYNLGIRAGANVPVLTASAHFYIRDRAAWDAAGMQAFPQLAAEGPNYTDISPFIGDMEVAAVG